MQPLQFGIIGGAVVALVGTLLDWVKLSAPGLGSESFNGWAGELTEDDEDLGGRLLQIADVTSLGLPIDTILIVLLCAAAAGLIVAPLLNIQVPQLPPLASAGLGAVAVIIGVLNYVRFSDKLGDAEEALQGLGDSGISAEVGMGLYITIIGAAAVAVCSFLDYQQRSKQVAGPPAPRPMAPPPPPPQPPGGPR